MHRIYLSSLHPGVVATDLMRHVSGSWFFRLLWPIGKHFIKTPFHGAQTTLFCALEPSIEHHSGRYYSDCREKQAGRRARNKEDQKRLWGMSERLVGIGK